MPTLKLDLGAGSRPTEGFKSVDVVGDPDYLVDLFQYPWPFKDRSVREACAHHFIEHIPHYRPEYNGVDGFWMFFNELHRVCTKNAKVTLTCPYFKNDRAFYDPSHTRYIHWMNFHYFDPQWMAAQQLEHYPITAHFQVVNIAGAVPDSLMNRTQEYQDQARDQYWNAMGDLEIILKAIK